HLARRVHPVAAPCRPPPGRREPLGEVNRATPYGEFAPPEATGGRGPLVAAGMQTTRPPLAARSGAFASAYPLLRPLLAPDAADQRRTVAAAVRALPGRCPQVVAALMSGSDPTYREISRELGISQGSLGPLRSRCLGCLRTALKSRVGPLAVRGNAR